MKAILVFDIESDNANDVQVKGMSIPIIELYSKSSGKQIKVYSDLILKPIPKKKSVFCNKGVGKKTHYEESKYVIGFNDCIDEILGERE